MLFRKENGSMKLTKTLVLIMICSRAVFAQDDSPYKTKFKVDAPIIAAGVGLNFLGYRMVRNKAYLTEAEVNSLSKQDVNFIDRFAAGKYSERADKISYYPFYASFAVPIAMLLNKSEGKKAGQIMALYIETMSITGAMFTMAAANVQRSRPLVYNTSLPMEQRTDNDAQRSFYAGHVAATASATFFAAKVFSDFNPDSRAKPYIWAAAAIVPAVVGYYRLEGGKHFLTDDLLGYALGASVGVLVPHLHKKTNNSSLSISPVMAPGYKGTQLSYTFK